MNSKCFGLLLLLGGGCGHVNQVNLTTGVGEEFRPASGRSSATLGLAVKTIEGIDASATYRARVNDLDGPTLEHGVFVGVSVPIWRHR